MHDIPLTNPLAAIPILFGAGVVTSVLPCVYPMIPITAAILGGVGSARRTRTQTVLATTVYVLGLALVYATLGVLAGLTGSLFGTISANRWAYLVMGSLLLLFALGMWEVFPIRVPAGVAAWASRFGGGSYGAIFLMGATSGLVAAPCGAPAFAAVLTYVGTTGSALLGFIYLFVFSLGMTALLVAVGLSSGLLARFPRGGRWTRWAKVAAGGILLIMAEYYFVKAGQVW